VIPIGGGGFETGALDTAGAGGAGREIVGAGVATGVTVEVGVASATVSGVASVAMAEDGELLGAPPPTP